MLQDKLKKNVARITGPLIARQHLRSRKQVCRFVIKEQGIVVARGKPAKIVSKKQQVQFVQSNFFTNKP